MTLSPYAPYEDHSTTAFSIFFRLNFGEIMATCQICGGKTKGFLTEICDSCRPTVYAEPTAAPELKPQPIPATSEPEEGNRLPLKLIGFVFGFCVVAGLETVLLLTIHGMPRGIGWAVFPFIGGSALASASPRLVDRFSNYSSKLWREDKIFRFTLALSGIWLLAVPAYWWFFEPYDGYIMDSYDYKLMLKAMVFPIIVLMAGYFAYVKIVAPPIQPSDDE